MHLGPQREPPNADAQHASWCSPFPRKLPGAGPELASPRPDWPPGGYRDAIAAGCFEYAADRGELSLQLYDVSTVYSTGIEAESEDELRKIDYSEKPRIIVGPTTPPPWACVRQQTSAARGTRPDRGVRRQL